MNRLSTSKRPLNLVMWAMLKETGICNILVFDMIIRHVFDLTSVVSHILALLTLTLDEVREIKHQVMGMVKRGVVGADFISQY